MDRFRIDPIVPGARWMVFCSGCDYGHDSAAPTEPDAIAETLLRHNCGSPMTAEPVDYSDHPIYKSKRGRHG